MNKGFHISENSPIRKVLVVDDEKGLLMVLTKSLQRAGFDCHGMTDAVSAWKYLTESDEPLPDLIISDIAMPGMDGIELLKRVKEKFPEIDVIIMTGYASEYSYVDIMEAGASDYMSKPFDMDSALARISRIIREKQNLIELRKAIGRANRLAKEADQASKAKTFFLASMSHEIRTPLNGIVGYTDMLMDTGLDDEQTSFVKAARLSCDALLSVVNDILDFSKVEAGKLHLEAIEFDPEVLCFDTIDLVRTQVDESRVELLCRISDHVPGQVKGDPHRFRQVLINLLGNAVKFTHEGSIILSLEAEELPDKQTRLTVSVADTGIGIVPEELESIFEPFIQSESDITARAGGTGLGLAISRNIAHKMDGHVWAESVKGKGSTFYFTASLETGDMKKIHRVRPVGLSGKKVLMSTTTPEALDILTRELSLSGMEIHHDPLETLVDYLDSHKGSEYDICVIDFGKTIKQKTEELPTATAGLIRALAPATRPFRFIACAVPFPGIAGLFEKAGFRGFLPKPIRKSSLFEMMAYVMGMTVRPSMKPDSEPDSGLVTVHSLAESRKYGVSILLVEDNPVNQKMTKLMLSKAGYTVTLAANGREAVDRYIESAGEFDLIFMDINMPKMDGFEATRHIRAHEADTGISPRIPILALTANVLDDFKHKCDEAGMDDFLTKPIKRDLVFQSIQKWSAGEPAQ